MIPWLRTVIVLIIIGMTVVMGANAVKATNAHVVKTTVRML